MKYIPIVCEQDAEFAAWLNEIDTRIDYEVRRQVPLIEWQHLYELSYSVKDACLKAWTGYVR